MKQDVGELAVFGGIPAFERRVHVGRPNVGDRERLGRRFGDLLDRRWLTNDGRYVREFEEEVARLSGVRHCVATCNGTLGLEIALRAAGVRGEVILPSFTFVATAHAVEWIGCTPVFCDVGLDSHTIDPAEVERAVTPRTAAILGVHLWGRSCDVEALETVADRHGLTLLFDAAHAFGCSHGGEMIGRFGDAEVFSFHATKFVNAFEGGAVVTDDDALAERMRLMRNFGFAGYDRVVSPGTNAKMNEASAAMGLTSLESMAEFVEINRRNHDRYAEGLDGRPGLSLLRFDERERRNYQYVVVEVDPGTAGIGRDALVRLLQAENVLARRYFHPGCHRMEPYRSRVPDAGRRLPRTERLSGRLLSLPTGTAVRPEEIDEICSLLRLAVGRGEEVSRRMEACDPAAAGS